MRRLTSLLLFAAFLLSSLAFETALAQTKQKKPAAKQELEVLDKALEAARDKSDVLKKKAADLEDDIVRLRDGMVAAARLIQDHEARVQELTARMAKLTQDLIEREDRLSRGRAQMGRVLLALQRVAQYPPEALIARPITPGETVRSAILLRAVVPELEHRAIRLRADVDALRLARAEADRNRKKLNEAKTELDQQRKLLRTLLGRKTRLRRRTVARSEAAERRVRDLSRKAKSLRDLMGRLEAMRREQIEKRKKAKPENRQAAMSGPPRGYTGKPIDGARGRLPYPVVGKVVAGFGEKTRTGFRTKGISIETAAGAQVIAPYEGRVAFAGPFRGYGQLLIIEHREGYHTLLAGMARIDGIVGQWLLAGEPVGVMGRHASTKNGTSPALYVELRRNGQPVDPHPWLVSRVGTNRKGKVSG